MLKSKNNFNFLLIFSLINIIYPQKIINSFEFNSSIDGTPTIFSINKDPASESIYSMRSSWSNVRNSFNTKELGNKNLNKGITTRQIKGAGRLYKKSAPGVVILASIDASSMGSGAIISNEGEIITNWHVIKGHDKMLVWLYNADITSRKDLDPNSYLIAKVVAEDISRDLAFLQIQDNIPNLTPLSLGRDYELNIADDVFAIGHPESYFWSFTYGVISQIRREFDWNYNDNDSFIADVIQTQTPTNPGNSGGPLFNDKGILVGINTFGDDGQGLNFAITVGEVRSFISDVEKGKFKPIERVAAWEAFDSDKNGKSDYYLRDVDNDGIADISKIDENEDGVIRLAMKIGMPLIVVVAISIITTFLKSNLLFSKEYISTLLFSKNFEEYKNYSFLAQTNILIIIIWVLSTFHYLTIFRLGAVQLIAFQFTVSVFSLYKSNKIIKIVKDKI